MSRVTSSPRHFAAALVLAVLLATRLAAAPENPSPGGQATCVFSNPAYSGNCTQTVPVASGSNAAQACQSVLECLNNAQCEKTYCNATTVRGGWQLVSSK